MEDNSHQKGSVTDINHMRNVIFVVACAIVILIAHYKMWVPDNKGIASISPQTAPQASRDHTRAGEPAASHADGFQASPNDNDDLAGKALSRLSSSPSGIHLATRPRLQAVSVYPA